VDLNRFKRVCQLNKSLVPADTIRRASCTGAPSATSNKPDSALWGSYLECRLRELGAVDRKLIKTIKESFEKFDVQTLETAEEDDDIRYSFEVNLTNQRNKS